jgi:hypothetical protein
VHLGHSFSVRYGVCSGELDHGASALPNSVPLKPFPSFFFFLVGGSLSEVRSTVCSATLRSTVSFARICRDSTVALLSSSSCPRRKSRWHMVGRENSSCTYEQTFIYTLNFAGQTPTMIFISFTVVDLLTVT